MKNIESIAVEILRCALSHEPAVALIGNVTALDIAILAVRSIDTCPSCGSTAWVNIDCELCEFANHEF